MGRRWAVGLVGLMLLSSAAYAADERYVVKMRRASRVGDAFDIRMSVDTTRTTTEMRANAAPQVTTTIIKGDLTARVDVRAVDANGERVSFALTIGKLADGAGKELVASGKVILVNRGEDAVTFALADGSQLSAEAAKLLGAMYSKHVAGAPSDDEIFGSEDPQKVGASWSIHAEAAAKGMAAGGLTVAPQDISGKMMLKSVETVGGVPALRLEGDISARNLWSPGANGGVTIDNAESHDEVSALYPVDTSMMELEQTMRSRSLAHITSGTIKVDVLVDKTRKITLTPAKK